MGVRQCVMIKADLKDRIDGKLITSYNIIKDKNKFPLMKEQVNKVFYIHKIKYDSAL